MHINTDQIQEGRLNDHVGPNNPLYYGVRNPTVADGYSLFFNQDGILCKIDNSGVVTQIEIGSNFNIAKIFAQDNRAQSRNIPASPPAPPTLISDSLTENAIKSFLDYDSSSGMVVNTTANSYDVFVSMYVSIAPGAGSLSPLSLGIYLSTDLSTPVPGSESQVFVSNSGDTGFVQAVVTLPGNTPTTGVLSQIKATGTTRAVNFVYRSFEVRQW